MNAVITQNSKQMYSITFSLMMFSWFVCWLARESRLSLIALNTSFSAADCQQTRNARIEAGFPVVYRLDRYAVKKITCFTVVNR